MLESHEVSEVNCKLQSFCKFGIGFGRTQAVQVNALSTHSFLIKQIGRLQERNFKIDVLNFAKILTHRTFYTYSVLKYVK